MSTEESMDVSNAENISEQTAESESPPEVSFFNWLSWMFTFRKIPV